MTAKSTAREELLDRTLRKSNKRRLDVRTSENTD